MEVIRKEDGFNVVSLKCDGCGTEVPQVRHAGEDWFQVKLEPLSRDHWNKEDTIGEFHFCSPKCYKENLKDLPPLADKEDEMK